MGTLLGRESPEWKSRKFCENMFFVFSEDGSFREKIFWSTLIYWIYPQPATVTTRIISFFLDREYIIDLFVITISSYILSYNI